MYGDYLQTNFHSTPYSESPLVLSKHLFHTGEFNMKVTLSAIAVAGLNIHKLESF